MTKATEAKAGEFFSYEELGDPKDPAIKRNLKLLAVNVLDPLRRIIGLPVIITSAYRDPKKNEAVGGVKNSQHLKGQAVDLYVQGLSLDVVYNIIKDKLPYDQLIYYRAGARGSKYGFIHVSYQGKGNRYQTWINESTYVRNK